MLGGEKTQQQCQSCARRPYDQGFSHFKRERIKNEGLLLRGACPQISTFTFDAPSFKMAETLMMVPDPACVNREKEFPKLPHM